MNPEPQPVIETKWETRYIFPNGVTLSMKGEDTTPIPPEQDAKPPEPTPKP